jgi:pimeloyl-ACP methyl ester carboxylesterase
MARRVAVVGLLVLSGLLATLTAQSAPIRLTVVVDGHPLAVWARVPATPRAALVLIHGRTWSSRPDFDLQVPGLQRSVLASLAAQGIAAYAVDLRGYGETPRDKTGFLTPRRAADDVIAVMQFVATRHPTLPAPSLLGWSQGAAVAHLVAQTPGVPMSSLVLFGFVMDPDLTFADVAAPEKPAFEKTTRAQALSDFIAPKVTPRAVMDAFAQQAVKADPVRMDWIKEGEFNTLDPAQLTMPTLVLHGSEDPGVPMDVAAKFYERIAASRRQWTVLPGADHAAQLEDTHTLFVTAVADFITRVARK